MGATGVTILNIVIAAICTLFLIGLKVDGMEWPEFIPLCLACISSLSAIAIYSAYKVSQNFELPHKTTIAIIVNIVVFVAMAIVIALYKICGYEWWELSLTINLYVWEMIAGVLAWVLVVFDC